MVTEGRLSIPDWTPRLVEGLRIALEFALVILVAFLVAKLAWLLVAPGERVSTLTPRPLPAQVQQAGSPAVRADLSLLMTTNPFEADVEAETAVPDAPETKLNLKLVALFMSTGETSGSATIVTPDNETVRYELGDEILPGVRLERILSDRVIISRDGREEMLMRGGREPGLSVIGDTSTARTATNGVSRAAPEAFAPGVTARTLLAAIEPFPQEQNGRLSSILLRPRGNPSLMQSAGLEPGDRLVEINGKRVAEIDLSALADEFGAARTARVTVIRDGTTQSLDIRFEEG